MVSQAHKATKPNDAPFGDCAALRAWRERCPELRLLWDESLAVTGWQGVTFGEAGGVDAGRVAGPCGYCSPPTSSNALCTFFS
jgi:hypothetical protein